MSPDLRLFLVLGEERFRGLSILLGELRAFLEEALRRAVSGSEEADGLAVDAALMAQGATIDLIEMVDRAGEVMAIYREFIKTAPEELGAFFAFQIAPPLEFIPAEHHGETLCLIVTCWSGDPEDGPAAIAPLLDAAPVVAQGLGVMPYPALNSAFDALLPPGLQHYWKAAFVTELTNDAIRAHLTWGPQVPCVESTMHLYPINGASQRVPADATAWGHRDASFACVIAGMWPDPADSDANTAWVRGYYDAIAPIISAESMTLRVIGPAARPR